ncbi:MAG: phenylalanine--tRNA ligase subunit beta [Bdellovibrionales bacterium]
MKISLKWIHEFVQVEDYFNKPQELAEILTRAGFEVEGIQDARHLYHQIVVGHILEKAKHPNADKLSVCRVTTGQNQVHQIVCGAQNHKVGDRVVVALPGAVLPGNFAIKKSTLRGVESAGMLCSFKELGLPETSDGIAILDEDAPVGKAFAEHWGLDDIIFELKVTPNRADGLSHYGLAREIGALLQRDVKPIPQKLSGTAAKQAGDVKVEVKASDLCPRYMGRMIEGVRVEPSPSWLKKKIESVGMKSINNVVDVTNLILIELGQPLHAFDADQIQGGKLVIDRARAQEKFKTLDGTDISLKDENLTIRDSQRPLCLAGVIGGLNSGTTVDTKRVFLEAAYFRPESVRKTARSFGIETDSSYRFARGIDPEMTEQALARAVELIQKVAGGTISQDYVDWDSREIPVRRIQVSAGLISQRLGYAASLEKIHEYAKRLHLKIENDDGVSLTLIPPSFRQDLQHEMDFVEEYARLDGYDKIPETLPAYVNNPTLHDKGFTGFQSLGHVMTGLGFSQSLNFAFGSSQVEKKFVGSEAKLKAVGLSVSQDRIALLNPLNEDLNVMRSTLTLGLWQNVLHNYRHGLESGRLFEHGKTFVKYHAGISEVSRLAATVWGHEPHLWSSTSSKIPPVYQLKGVLDVWAKKFCWSSLLVRPGSPDQAPDFLHQGQWGIVEVEGQAIGFLGTLHPGLLHESKVRVPVAVMELEMDRLLEKGPVTFKVQTPSKLPSVQRDLALVMPEDLPVGEIMKTLRHKAGGLLVDLRVLDVFRGEPLESGKKSVAIRFVLQDREATLQEDKVNALQQKLVEDLMARYPVALR